MSVQVWIVIIIVVLYLMLDPTSPFNKGKK